MLSLLQRDLVETLLLSPGLEQSDRWSSSEALAEAGWAWSGGMAIIQLAEIETLPSHRFAGVDISRVSNCTFSCKRGEDEYNV